MSGEEKIEQSDHVCEACNQPKPTSDPYRGSVPEEEVEEETPFSAIRGKSRWFGSSWRRILLRRSNGW